MNQLRICLVFSLLGLSSLAAGEVSVHAIFDEAASAGTRAAAYLPDGVALKATVYPVIKHTINSFVCDLDGDPALFMSVDPASSPVFVESVLTHELHHVGLAQCPDSADYQRLIEPSRRE